MLSMKCRDEASMHGASMRCALTLDAGRFDAQRHPGGRPVRRSSGNDPD
jgi:hypothetical protein